MQKAKTEGEEEKEEMNGHGKSQSLLLMLLHRAPHYIQWKSTKNRPHRLGPGTQTLPLTLHSKGHGPIRQCGQWHTLKHRHKYSLSVFRGKEDSSIINTAAAASASTLLANTHCRKRLCKTLKQSGNEGRRHHRQKTLPEKRRQKKATASTAVVAGGIKLSILMIDQQ